MDTNQGENSLFKSFFSHKYQLLPKNREIARKNREKKNLESLVYVKDW